MICWHDDDMSRYRGGVLVTGCFDPLHHGHVHSFAIAKALAMAGRHAIAHVTGCHDMVVCGVASDTYIRQEKRRSPLLPRSDRMRVLEGCRDVDVVCVMDESGDVGLLRRLQPRVYLKGLDWAGRLPAGIVAMCREEHIDIQYAPVLASSTTMLAQFVASTHTPRMATDGRAQPLATCDRADCHVCR